jgi:predicted AlkP superfamily pyrophosphatase or phosphodiesterase
MDDFFLWFEGTPMLDDATLRLAKVALVETGAGTEEGRTDFLSISLSQTDRVGHPFGPLSREQMDNLLRLDRILGDFLTFLDEEVGKGNYVMGLSADHGVMTAPERLGQAGTRLTGEDRSLLQQVLNQAAEDASRDPNTSLAASMVKRLADVPFVGPAYTHVALESGEALDSIGDLYRHSLVPGRAGGLLSTYGVEMWWTDNTLAWSLATGTTHGGPYLHDRWVPLVLVGPGIDAGVVDVPVRPMDLAPTLALLAGIPFPDDLDGKPLPLGGG